MNNISDIWLRLSSPSPSTGFLIVASLLKRLVTSPFPLSFPPPAQLSLLRWLSTDNVALLSLATASANCQMCCRQQAPLKWKTFSACHAMHARQGKARGGSGEGGGSRCMGHPCCGCGCGSDSLQAASIQLAPRNICIRAAATTTATTATCCCCSRACCQHSLQVQQCSLSPSLSHTPSHSHFCSLFFGGFLIK